MENFIMSIDDYFKMIDTNTTDDKKVLIKKINKRKKNTNNDISDTKKEKLSNSL